MMAVIVGHIRSHEELLESLPEDQRSLINDASATVRKARRSVPVAFGHRLGNTGMTDNSAALRRARRRDSRAKRQQAADALHTLEQGGEAISFPAVARRAGVSVSLPYADPELTARIAAARDRQRQAGHQRTWQLPARSLVTEQGLRAELANTKEQARRLMEEVTVLQDRLARQLGADADFARGQTMSPLLDQLEDRNAELDAANNRLHQQVIHLEGEVRELTDTLDAARAMNRELMSELNRDTPAVRRVRLREQRPPHTFNPLTSAFVHNPNRTAALLDRLLHRSVVLDIGGDSYRLRDHHARTHTLRAAAHHG